MSLNMTKGLIPLPPIAKKDLITNKPDGAGVGYYGQRTVKGFVLHRMQGTLNGTDIHFRDPAVRALTDFGCDHTTGTVYQWCDPYGIITPWASGPVVAPYGDGKAFVEKYATPDKNVVNRDQVSWEVSGYFKQPLESFREDPWAEVSRQVTAQALAHYAHDYGIPWDVFPIAPQDGFSFLRWHNEFIAVPQLNATYKVPKVCPGQVCMELTNDLIARAKEIMRKAQTTVALPPAPSTWVDASNNPTPLGLEKLFGEVRTYNENGPVSIEWRKWCNRNNLWPELIDVRTIPIHDGPAVLYSFENGLRIIFNPRTRLTSVLGVLKTTAEATQVAVGA